jgi:cyclic pyranopterin phosphate synthase
MKEESSAGLTHVNQSGEARMVDVGAKAETERQARASGSIRMRPDTLAAIRDNQVKKGDVLAVARIAGIQAAKRTAELVPLCHPIPLTAIEVDLALDEALPGVRVNATVRTTWKTGVEMEALTAVTVSLLTIYDMAKSLDRGMELDDISLVEKTGGKLGHWSRG